MITNVMIQPDDQELQNLLPQITRQLKITVPVYRIARADDGTICLWLYGRTEPVFYVPEAIAPKRTKAHPKEAPVRE